MGFYDRHILPRILASGMGAEPIAHQRAKIVPRAEGRVLEIGFGAGHNLPFYDTTKVTHLWALEPAAEMRMRAAQRVAASPILPEFLDLPSESIPLEDNAADTVLVTYTLCSIGDVSRALGEMRRVLKPSGRLLFCEHGAAPEESVRRWQDRLTPVTEAIAGGCHLNRPVPELIAASGLRLDELATMYIPRTPRFAAFNYWGSARKD